MASEHELDEDCSDGGDSIASVGESARELRKMRCWQATLNNIAFMASAFAMPSIFAQTGWWFGIGFLLHSSLLTFQNGLILGDIVNLHPELYTYPAMAEKAFVGILGRCSKEAGYNGAKTGRFVVQAIQAITMYLTSATEVIYMAEYLALLLPDVPICDREWLLVVGAIAWPFMLIPTLEESSYAALITVSLLFFNIVVFVAEVFIVLPWNCDPPPVRPAPSVRQVVSGLTGIAYAFGGHNLFPEQLREMKHPENWKHVMTGTYSFLVPCYLLMSILGYYAYGVNASANLNANFPSNSLNKISIIMQTVQEIYYIFFGNLVIVLQLELALGINPKVFCKEPQNEVHWDSESEEDVDAEGDEDEEDEEERSAGTDSRCVEYASLRICGVPPCLFRVIWRTTFLASQVGLCYWMMLGSTGKDLLSSLRSLAGAVGYTALTYILPLVFGWALLPRPGVCRLIFEVVSFICCIVLLFVGITVNVSSFAEVLSLKDESECKAHEAIGGGNESCFAAVGNVTALLESYS